MRPLAFTLLAIVIGTAVQLALTHLPYYVRDALHGIDIALMFVLPVVVTAGLAYVMRVDFYYALVAGFLSPFVCTVLGVFFALFVLKERML